jgi:hypothetical protein
MSHFTKDDLPYEEIENYIKLNEPHGYLLHQCLSPSFYQAEKAALKNAIEAKEPNLFFFANNGYRSYFYFKSHDKEVYLIEFFLGEIYDYLRISSSGRGS